MKAIYLLSITFYVLNYTLNENVYSSDTFLNGKHLTPEVLLEETGLLPQTSIVKSKSYVPLNVPPMSICFFVLPKARVPACINEENKNEIFSQGNSSPSEKEVLSFQLRSFFNRDSGLEGLKRKTRKQLEPEEKLFKNDLKLKFDNLKQNIYSDSRESQIHPSRRRYHLEKSKRQDMDMEKLIKRRDELKKSVLGPRKQEIKSRGKYLDLMSEETGRILKDRARARAARRNVFLTEDELDLIVEAVRRKLIKPDYKQPNSLTEIGMRKRMQSTEESEASSGEPTNQFRRSRRRPRDVNSKLLNLRSKIEERRQRLEEKMSEVVGNAQNLRHDIKERLQKLKQMNHRFRRDINMELLNLKMEEQKKKAKKQMKMQSKGFFKDREVRKSSLRKSEKTSDELSESDDVESVEKVIPAMEFFTKSVTSEESKEETIDSLNNNKGPKKLSLFNKKGTNKFAGIKPTSSDLYEKSESEEANNSNDLLTFSDEFNDFGGELPCMYQYFGSQRKDASNTDKVGEILRKWNKQNKRKGKMVRNEGSISRHIFLNGNSCFREAHQRARRLIQRSTLGKGVALLVMSITFVKGGPFPR